MSNHNNHFEKHCINFYTIKCMLRINRVGAVVKNLPPTVGDTRDAGLILGLGRSFAEGNGNPL